MKTAKLTEQYDRSGVTWTRCNFENVEWGFDGSYVCKEGEVSVCVCQTCDKEFYLTLTIHKNGRDYIRSFKCSCLPTHRLAAKKAKQFLKEINKKMMMQGEK